MEKEVTASRTLVHSSAHLSESAVVGQDTQIWNHAQIRENVKIGSNVIIGTGVYIGPGVVVGDRSKIQNLAQIYEPACLEEGVFIGPAVILTNDKIPRSINTDKSQKNKSDWKPVGVTIRQGASIGAGTVCIAPIEIGEWAMIGAGSVVTKNVPNFALFVGNPARFVCWISRTGATLEKVATNKYMCPDTKEKYVLVAAEQMEIQ